MSDNFREIIVACCLKLASFVSLRSATVWSMRFRRDAMRLWSSMMLRFISSTSSAVGAHAFLAAVAFFGGAGFFFPFFFFGAFVAFVAFAARSSRSSRAASSAASRRRFGVGRYESRSRSGVSPAKKPSWLKNWSSPASAPRSRP